MIKAENKVPYATPLIFRSNIATRTILIKIFNKEKNPTAKLEVLVFCNPTNNPVMMYNVNSPGAE